MCDYGPGISAEPMSGGTGRLGRALALGPRSLLSVPRPLPSQKFKGMVSGSLHQRMHHNQVWGVICMQERRFRSAGKL